MIIGFDASRAFTQHRTGTENYSYQLLTHLAKIDHTNTYKVYLRPSGTQGPLRPRLSSTQAQSEASQALRSWPANFEFITIPYSRLWTQVGLATQTFRDPLDILFVPSHTLPLIRKPNLKTVVTVHDLGAEYLPTTHQLKQRLYLNFMTRYQLQSATHIITVSQATKNDLVKRVGIPDEKISVVYEGYNNQLFGPVKNDVLVNILRGFDLVPQNFFLFVGTIQPRKNIERLISAYAEFLKYQQRGVTRKSEIPKVSPAATLGARTDDGKLERQDPELIIVGSKGWLSDEIYQLPKKLGVENQVKFLGYVPDEKLPALYSGAMALLFPSLFEGFGLPILEAFACSCPVLTSNISSLPEVAGKAALLINPYSISKISQGIIQLATNQKLRHKLIQAGHQQLKKFSWEKAAKQTLQVLTNTCP